MDEAALVALLAALSTNVGIRDAAKPGYWVYIATDAGDFNAGLLAGDFASDAVAAEFRSNSDAVYITSQTSYALNALSQAGTAVRAQGNGSQPALEAINVNGGRALLAQGNGSQPVIVGENTGNGPALRLTGNAADAALYVDGPGQAVQIDVSGFLAAVITSTGTGGVGALIQGPGVGVQGNSALGVGVAATSGGPLALDVAGTPATADDTGIRIQTTAGQQFVKLGPAGSGPGGVGRALYVD